jgi:hypothetical protein
VTNALDTIPSNSVYYLCNQRGPAHDAQAFATQCAETLDDIAPSRSGSQGRPR